MYVPVRQLVICRPEVLVSRINIRPASPHYSANNFKEQGRNKFAILSVEAPAWQGAKV